jgi:hypothetical protein
MSNKMIQIQYSYHNIKVFPIKLILTRLLECYHSHIKLLSNLQGIRILV